jgi:hypothetical protein
MFKKLYMVLTGILNNLFKKCFFEKAYLIIFLKAPGVSKLNSYWFKGFRKQLLQSYKSFRKLLGPISKGFRNPFVFTIFRRFLQKFSSGFWRPTVLATRSFRKLFKDSTSSFLETQKELANFFMEAFEIIP